MGFKCLKATKPLRGGSLVGIWLKGRYIDKMPMYSRHGKESSVQSMNTVSRGVMPPPKIWSPL